MKLLILNSTILACGDLIETDDSIQSVDAIYPKHVIAGWQIVDAEVPEGFAPAGYEWDGGQVVARPPVVVPPTREELKAARQAAVDAIKVTVSTGKIFDGDEMSQTRMSRAIIGLQAAGVPTITWTLADNTSVDVTLAELTEALILAGQEQARLWVIE